MAFFPTSLKLEPLQNGHILYISTIRILAIMGNALIFPSYTHVLSKALAVLSDIPNIA